MKKKTKVNKKFIFILTFISSISAVLSSVALIFFTLLVFEFGDWELLLPKKHNNIGLIYIMILVVSFSLLIGLFGSILASIRFLKPVKELKKMTSKVSKGDFTVSIKEIPDNELGEFIQDFNTMVEELRKNEMLKNDFISNVSHEFKTPLSVIEGYVTLLQDPSLSEEERTKYSQIVIDSTKRLNNLVNNILKISKIDNRKLTVVNDDFYLDEQIRESILLYEEEWSNKNIELDINLDKVKIISDQQLLVNVWNNLISNAIKYSKENSKISIYLVKKEHEVEVIVSDQGCGIPKDDLPYIFDKFFQSDKSHTSEGNGLGLTLAKEIVELLKGNIYVESELNVGTTFKVTLPIGKTK